MNGGVQWKPTSNFELDLNGIYAQDRTKYDVNQQVFLFNQPTVTTLATTGLTATKVVATNFTMENNRQLEVRNLTSQDYNATAKWRAGDGWTLKSTVNYTRGTSYDAEEAAIVGLNIGSATLDITNPSNVLFDISNDLTNKAQYDPTLTTRNEYPDGAQTRLVSTETSGQLDVNKDLGVGPLASLDFGAKYRLETFDRYVMRRDRGPYSTPAPSALPTFVNNSYLVSGFLNGDSSIQSAWVAPDIEAYRAALAKEGAVVPTVFAPEASYHVDRYMPSVYGMLNIETEALSLPIHGNIGVRYEHTRQVVGGYLTTPNDAFNVNTVTGTYSTESNYGNVLPSANVVIDLTRKLLLRGALAKVLVRPILDSATSLAQVASTSANSTGTNTTTVDLSQATLKPLTANQADLSLEWYHGRGSSISLAGFYKSVKNGTFSQIVCPASYAGSTLSLNSAGDCVDTRNNVYDITQTLNDASSVTIKGFEVAVSQAFDFLPVKGFGFTGNYTHVIPRYGTGQGFRVRNLSKNTWNATGYWENDMFSVRASLNHRSPYDQTSSDSFFAREGHTVKARTQLDLALGFAPTPRINFAAGVINLNNTREEAYLLTESRWQETSYFGRSFYLSASTRF